MSNDEYESPSSGMPRVGGRADPRRPRPSSPRFDDPLSWSVAILRLGGITIRFHAVLLVTILILLLRSAWFQGDAGGVFDPGFSLVLVVCVFWVPMVGELALAIGASRLGGAVSEVVIHPFGGLDTFVFPPGWKRQAIASMCGVAVLGVMMIAIGLGLALATGDTAFGIPPNPFSLEGLYQIHMLGSWWLSALYILQLTTTVVLLANLLPVPPMRGWNLLHALLRSRYGWTRGKVLALRIGSVVAIAIAAGGLVFRELLPVLLAIFCAVCLREEFARLKALKTSLGHERDDHALLHAETLIEQEEAASSAVIERLRRVRQEALLKEEEDALDRILAKISREGRGSLDRTERRLLKRATRRRQHGKHD